MTQSTTTTMLFSADCQVCRSNYLRRSKGRCYVLLTKSTTILSHLLLLGKAFRNIAAPFLHYRIVLIFRGSKLSRIATLKEFVEIISRIRVAHVCNSAVAQILVE